MTPADTANTAAQTPDEKREQWKETLRMACVDARRRISAGTEIDFTVLPDAIIPRVIQTMIGDAKRNDVSGDSALKALMRSLRNAAMDGRTKGLLAGTTLTSAVVGQIVRTRTDQAADAIDRDVMAWIDGHLRPTDRQTDEREDAPHRA